MKILITTILMFLSVGCAHKYEMGIESIEALTNQLEGKSLSHIEVYNIINAPLVHKIDDIQILNEFRDSLATCTPMPQIDTMGSHHILVYSKEGVTRFDTDFHYFIRIPDWNGQDAYFKCSSELISVLRKIKANQKLDPTVETPVESGNVQGTAGQL